MKSVDTNKTPVDNDFTPLKERANRILNSIDSLLSSLGVNLESEITFDDTPAQPLWTNPSPVSNIDPTTGLPQTIEDTTTPQIDPETGLPFAGEGATTPDLSQLAGQITSVETKLSGVENRANSALPLLKYKRMSRKLLCWLSQQKVMPHAH